MIIFHSINRKVEKSGPSSKVVLEMPYEDVKDLCHILWKCRDKDMLKRDNEKFLQLQFQNLRHLMVDGQVCEPFEICSLHEGLEKMGWGDERQGFKEWHDLEKHPEDLPRDYGEDWVLVKIKDEETGEVFNKPHIAEYRKSDWYLDDPNNTKVGSKSFPFKVVQWSII